MTSISAENSALKIMRIAFTQISSNDSSILRLYLLIIPIEAVGSMFRITSTSIFRALLFRWLKNFINDITNDGMKKAITRVIGFFSFACFVDIGDHG